MDQWAVHRISTELVWTKRSLRSAMPPIATEFTRHDELSGTAISRREQVRQKQERLTRSPHRSHNATTPYHIVASEWCCASQHFWPLDLRNGSKARITTPQHCSVEHEASTAAARIPEIKLLVRIAERITGGEEV